MNVNIINVSAEPTKSTKSKPKKRKVEEVVAVMKAPAQTKKAPEKKTVPNNKKIEEKKPSILKKVYAEVRFCDYTIKSGRDKKFPCHMVVLAAQASPVLRKKLEEDKEYDTRELTLQFNNNVVERFVRFFYDEEIKDERIKARVASVTHGLLMFEYRRL